MQPQVRRLRLPQKARQSPLLMTDTLIEGKGKRKSKSKDKGKSNRRSFDSLRSLRMTAFFGG
jgi:hypothetical protein